MSRAAVIALALVWVSPATVAAETIVASSPEWLTCESDLVVVGRVEKIVTTRGGGDVFYEDCTVVVKEVIRGKVDGDRLVFCLRTLSAESPAKGWMKASEPVLFFLSKSTGHGSEKHLDDLLVPTSHQFPLSVIDLGAPGKSVLDTGFNVLTDKKEILDTCRKTAEQLALYLKQNPGKTVTAVQLDVPISSAAWDVLYSGSACFIKAPSFRAKKEK
jgi:hypothetical protein